MFGDPNCQMCEEKDIEIQNLEDENDFLKEEVKRLSNVITAFAS